VRCDEQAQFTLSAGGQERQFRAYAPGEWYWLRPILPELLLSEGSQRIAVTGTGADVAIERVVLTVDPFWRPDDFVEFTAPEQVLAAQRAAAFTPVERRTVAASCGATPHRHVPPPTRAWAPHASTMLPAMRQRGPHVADGGCRCR